MVPGRGKGLVMLRMCNEMLRRLSKEKDTVFCGRILMFLANSFPLHERSGMCVCFSSYPYHLFLLGSYQVSIFVVTSILNQSFTTMTPMLMLTTR